MAWIMRDPPHLSGLPRTRLQRGKNVNSIDRTPYLAPDHSLIHCAHWQQLCPHGTSSPGGMYMRCTVCGAGHYATGTGSAHCQACPRGTMNAGGSRGWVTIPIRRTDRRAHRLPTLAQRPCLRRFTPASHPLNADQGTTRVYHDHVNDCEAW